MELLGSPGRALVSILLFMLAVIVLATAAYMAAGWSFADASYMVLITIFTVGYGEVRPDIQCFLIVRNCFVDPSTACQSDAEAIISHTVAGSAG